MRTSFYNLNNLGSEKYLWTKQLSFENLTRIFKEGSASARRPAVTQAVAPPELIQVVNTTASLQP
jgi:hypothetical protein